MRATDVNASITVKNNGPFPANDFAVQWKLRDGDNSGPLAFINGLNRGKSQTVSYGNILPGGYELTSQAIVDVSTRSAPGPCARTTTCRAVNHHHTA